MAKLKDWMITSESSDRYFVKATTSKKAIKLITEYSSEEAEYLYAEEIHWIT